MKRKLEITSAESSNMASDDRFGFFCRLNISSLTLSDNFKSEISILVLVAMTYDCGTRRSGTPFTLYGPERKNQIYQGI